MQSALAAVNVFRNGNRRVVGLVVAISPANAVSAVSEPPRVVLLNVVKEGAIPCARLGRRVLFSKKKLVAYLDGDS